MSASSRDLIAAFACLSLGTSPVIAQTKAAVGPRPNWAVQIAPGECTLLRTTAAPDASLLRLTTSVGTGRYRLALAGTGVRVVGSDMPEQVELRIDGKIVARQFGSQSSRPVSGFERVYNVSAIPHEVIDSAATGGELEVRASSRRIAAIPLNGAAKAFAALRTCEAEQLIEWGADPAQFHQGGALPKLVGRDQIVPQSLFRQIKTSGRPIKPEHYLVLSTAGVVEKCAAVHGIPDSNMEQVVCAHLLGRKIAEPARDASGRAVRGVVTIQPARILTMDISY
jgi:hypothetical protein